MRDFMLHVRPAAGAPAPHGVGALLRTIEARASTEWPHVMWHAEVSFGTDGHARIFSAPDYDSAMRVEALAREVDGLRADVMPLRPGA